MSVWCYTCGEASCEMRSVCSRSLLLGVTHCAGLDDSSQLPRDVLESMLGGLLDCSDSGPRPVGRYMGGGVFVGDSYNLQPAQSMFGEWSGPDWPASCGGVGIESSISLSCTQTISSV
jgi:hypothetical protein